MFYFECAFALDGGRFLAKANELYEAFDENIQTYCIGSVAEYYDANPPHAPRGAVSQAWSVAALLYLKQLIEKQEEAKAKAAKRTCAKAKKEVKNSKK